MCILNVFNDMLPIPRRDILAHLKKQHEFLGDFPFGDHGGLSDATGRRCLQQSLGILEKIQGCRL